MGVINKSHKINKDKEENEHENDSENDKVEPLFTEKELRKFKNSSEEYDAYCKKLKFIERGEITVRENEYFAYQYCTNYSIMDMYRKKIKMETLSKEIKYVEKASFYLGGSECGGSSNVLDIFKATKKGKFKIKISTIWPLDVKNITKKKKITSDIIKVNVI